MKVSYDQRTDTLTVIFRENVSVAESDEEKPGLIMDYDGDGRLVALELLDASKNVTQADRVDFEAR